MTLREEYSVHLLNMSGPYGAGKDTLLRMLMEALPGRFERLSTLTTRSVDQTSDPTYRSVTRDELTAVVDDPNWLINHQLAGAAAYATNLGEIGGIVKSGKLGLHSIFPGPAGAGALRRAMGAQLVSIAILPTRGGPSEQLAVLEARLLARGREQPDEIARRMAGQQASIDYMLSNPWISSGRREQPVFNYMMINDDLDECFGALLKFVQEGILNE